MDGDGFRAEPEQIARRLGLSEELVRRLQARGVLRSFDLEADEVRRRLCAAHQQHVAARDPQRSERR